MAVDDFTVRPYSAEDRARLLELLKQVWSHKHDIDAVVSTRWWWQFDLPPLLLVEDRRTQTLAGLAAYIPFVLRARRTERSAAWLVDFYVLPQHQGRGLGKRLTQAVEERFSVTASLSQTEMAYRVFQKMGWRQRTPVALCMNPLPVRWMLPKRRAVTVASVPTDGAWASGDLDQLWVNVRDAYPVIASRTEADIRKRYVNQGNRRYLLQRAHRNQQCVGYMVSRITQTGAGITGLIVDFLVHPDDGDAFAALLSNAVAAMIESGVKRVYCLSTARGIQRVLRSAGFLDPSTPLLGRFLEGQNKWLTYTTSGNPDPIDPAAWYLTLGDCDVDLVW